MRLKFPQFKLSRRFRSTAADVSMQGLATDLVYIDYFGTPTTSTSFGKVKLAGAFVNVIGNKIKASGSFFDIVAYKVKVGGSFIDMV